MKSSRYTASQGGRQKRRGMSWLLLLFMLIGAFAAGSYVWEKYVPSQEHKTPDFGGNPKPVFYLGQMLEEPASGKRESLKLSFDTVREWIDPEIHYEKASESTIITTKDKVIRLRTSELTARVNEKPFALKFPLTKADGKLYLPMDPLKSFYNMELRESEETGAVLLFKAGDTVKWYAVPADSADPEQTAAMRARPDIKSPILADLSQGTEVMVWEDTGEWYRVQLVSGYTGYVRKEQLLAAREERISESVTEAEFVPEQPIKGMINMTWEHVVSKNPDTEKIPPMPGVDVVSPTWFHLEDGEGNLQNLASPDYVKWAHAQGYQVWAIFSNGFDPKRTTAALSSYDKRLKMTKQLLTYAQMYSLQGINIDFENVNLSDKENLVQFVREMTPLLHEQGLIVSMDVTPKSTSESWSMFYDRPALIQSLDYMMLMAYDEHWASSPKAGSVASLPWVETSLKRLLEEDNIPPSKLLLGIPFYTRVWTETVKDGKTAVSSRAVQMSMPQRIIREQSLTPTFSRETGQNYIEYKEDGKLNKIWIEDETSVKARLELAKKYNLAGIASWRRGFEVPEAWDWIFTELESGS